MIDNQESEDPLDGADVGETRTVTATKRLDTIDLEPHVFWGSDRFGDAEVDELELVETENGGEQIKVTWRGDMTKKLPRRWDQRREPVTDREKKAERRKTLVSRIGTALGVIIPLGFAIIIHDRVMGSLDMTVNGQPVQPPSLGGVALVVIAIAIFVMWAAANAPGRATSGRRGLM